MQKTRTLFIAVNTPRRRTPESGQISQQVSQQTQLRGPSSSGTLPYCPVDLPPAATLYVSGSNILDDLGNVWGTIESGIPIPTDSFNQNPVLLALAARITSTQFNLPTNAERVVDVWFDSLHSDPETMWTFSPDLTINTTAALDSQILVQALYIGKGSG
jgi:hypothetical protein